MGSSTGARHSVLWPGRRPQDEVRAVAPQWLESIRREIDALTRISHPGVVRILDNGVYEGRPWYAMELLEGESLRRYADRLWSPYRARFAAARDSENFLPETERMCMSPRPPRQIRTGGPSLSRDPKESLRSLAEISPRSCGSCDASSRRSHSCTVKGS